MTNDEFVGFHEYSNDDIREMSGFKHEFNVFESDRSINTRAWFTYTGETYPTQDAVAPFYCESSSMITEYCNPRFAAVSEYHSYLTEWSRNDY